MSTPTMERLSLRETGPDELALAATVHASAFGRDEEARLPMAIVAEGHEVLSVAAEIDGFIVAHALFSPLGGPEGAWALGPVAVAPDHQGGGIGSALVGFGLQRARERGARSVFVLGEPSFYGRFGFSAEKARGAWVPWRGEMFQALELVPDALVGWSGALRYPHAFGADEVDSGDPFRS